MLPWVIAQHHCSESSHPLSVRAPACRYNSREAELRTLRMEVDRLSGAVSSAEDEARFRADALRQQLAAKQAQLDETQAHLVTTQASATTNSRLPTLRASGRSQALQVMVFRSYLVRWQVRLTRIEEAAALLL